MKTLTIIPIILLLIAGCAQQENIKLGVMMPLTGDASSVGEPIERSVEIAVQEINDKGGVNGQKIELIVEDSKCNPKDGANAATKLVQVDRVKFIIGGVCSGETLGAAPITESENVILFSPSSTSPDITTAGSFVFRNAPSDAFAGKIAAELADAKGWKNTAVISENTDYAQGLAKVFKSRTSELGGKVVGDETYNPDDTDFRTQVLKVKTSKPDVVYIVPQSPVKGVLLIQQLKEAGLDAQLLTGEVLIGRDVIKEHSKEMEGVIGIEPFFDENAAKAFTEQYKAKYGELPFPFFQAAAYDIVNLLAQGIKANGVDTVKVRDWLYTIKDWQGATGKLTLDSNGDPIISYSKKQVVNGELAEFK